MNAPEPQVSIVVPTYEDMELLADSLPPLLAHGPTVEVVVVNNDPSQDVQSWLRPHIETPICVLEMGHDAGFAAAVNRGIETSRGAFVMFGNADLFPSDGYLAEILAFFGDHPAAGAASGKILRYETGLRRTTDLIDTAGLLMSRNRRALMRGEGERDNGQFDRLEEVFGNDGVGLVVRRSALESIRIGREYLDESFFMYKEDWDLSWRLRLAGWECWYVPTAVAHHGRTSRGLGQTRYRSAIRQFYRNEQRKAEFIRFHSMKNQWLMLLKNEDWFNLIRDAHHIVAREVMVFAYNLVFAPRTLRAIPAFLRLTRSTLAKRRVIKSRQRATPREIRRWLVARPLPDRASERRREPAAPFPGQIVQR